MYSTSGTGTIDQDSNAPCDRCGTPTGTRGKGGKPPLSPKAGQANSKVLKRLSRAASKYGISLNLNLNLDSTRFRVHQAGNREYEENIFKRMNDERSDCHTDSYGSSEQGSVAGDDCHGGKPCQHHTHCLASQSVCDSDFEGFKRSNKVFTVTGSSNRAQPQIIRSDDENNNTDTDITRKNKKKYESKDSTCRSPSPDGRSTKSLTHPDENHHPTHCT
jgi:hypothetical protein